MTRAECFAALVAILVIFAPRSAGAGASARLVYVRDRGAERCPGEEAVRATVTARLGYDPFFAWAHDTLFAEVSRAAGKYRIVIRFVDDANRLRGDREIAVRDDDCSSLIEAMGLTISLTIDPSSVVGPPPAPATAASKQRPCMWPPPARPVTSGSAPAAVLAWSWG